MQGSGPQGLKTYALSLSDDAATRDDAARRNERRFRTALGSVVDPVAVVTAVTRSPESREIVDFVVSFANGRPGSPRVGTLVSNLGSSNAARLLAHYRRVLIDGRELVLEAVHQPGEDGGRYFDIRATRLDAAEVIATWRDVTDRVQAQATLEERSLHDPLTGLANRHLLLDRFRVAVDNLDRQPGAVVVLHIDLDRFKDINDTYGHSVGDDVLAEVGRRLDSLVDSPDTAARLAGDEFVIVTAARAARRGATGVTGVATRLADQVSEAIGEVIRLPEHDDATLQLSVSIGIAVTTSPESEPEQLLLQADRAMFEAKRRGRRRYEVFRQSLSTTANERLRIEQDARDAVANGWLRLQYQPVIDLNTGRLSGAEALLRIAHPERGMLRPGSFIDVLEDSDLILPIGGWVLTEACRQLGRWQEIAGIGDFSMAVNVSGRQASDRALTGHALEAAAAAGIDPSRLCLEMTERVLFDADDSVVADLRKLTSQGVRIALDDFGTGYASLSYLQRFPVSALKIDRSFVTGIGITTTDTAIVDSIVALARALNLDVVAEGVETEAQLEQLLDHECAKGQGYYFAPPLDAIDFEEALLAQSGQIGQ